MRSEEREGGGEGGGGEGLAGVAGDEGGEVPGDAVPVAERRRGAEEGLRHLVLGAPARRAAAAGGGIRGHGWW